MINDGKRASEVVSRLRALSKKTDPQRLRLDLNEVIDEVILLFQRELLNNRVALRLELASALPPVLGDRIQLQQVLMNLLINAIQAMAPVTDQPREVLIRSRRHDANQVVLEVMDSGIGITPENADRLFGAFFTTKPDGMGIGLSICRSIIEAHGGRIWASPNTGPGATLQFTLPLSEDNAS